MRVTLPDKLTLRWVRGVSVNANGCHYDTWTDRMIDIIAREEREDWHGCCREVNRTIAACEGTDADFIYERNYHQNLPDMQDKGAKSDVLALKYVNIY